MKVQNTKFVCTLGPSSESPQMIEKMIRAGMDCARLNFSHGSYENHAKLIKNVRNAAKKIGVPLSILQDLQGPKIRIGNIKNKGINVEKNQIIIFTCGKTNPKKIPVQYKNLYKDVKKGGIMLIDDGLIECRIIKITGKDIYCKILNSGIIKKNKGINVPDASIKINPVTAKDKKDLQFGLENNIDYVALSFVKEAQNIHDLRKIIKKSGKNVKIIAKIERKEAVQNLESILEAADGLMVARGDLAMEVGPERVPIIQKKMIKLCYMAGKPVITATQMLQSMTDSPQPTRAEVNDTANAIFDHSDAIMLSNETATGKYPVKAIQVFAKVAEAVEKELKKNKELLPIRTVNNKINIYDAMGYDACKLAETINANKLIIVTGTGLSALYVAKHRPYTPTIVITKNEKTRNQLSLIWGLNHIDIAKIQGKNYIDQIKKLLLKHRCVSRGEKAVILYAYSKEKHIVSIVI
ncbi:pyruvate kinase [Candidatus Peregrinibacteria bacterium]|nr:pyruvate kinase [Candidatus Peregrinibacteria bacterium]